MKKFKLSHKPSNPLPPPSIKEEREMMKDMILFNIDLFSPEELAQCVREKIVSVEELEDLCSPSNS